MKTIYECSHSKAMKRLSIAGILIITGAIVYEIWCVQQGMDLWIGITVTLILLAALVSVFMLHPQYIIADDEGIGIHTLIRTRKIPYSDIERIERAGENFMRWDNTIRLFGIGGMFGNIGWFRSSETGTYLAYVTDSTKAFIIYRKNGKPVAISVSEPDEFMPYFLKGGGVPMKRETPRWERK
ncbi:MAG: hypothetical protein II825_10090 [Paludibacteraceae bacterium]|nr:hypothetical protein [Paludibacteraceae bacterium]